MEETIKTHFNFKRIPDDAVADPNLLTVRIDIELDVTSPAAIERFSRVLKEILPAEDVQKFLDEFRRAALGEPNLET